MEKKVALIIGAGDSLGSSVARVFAKDGYIIVAARRNESELDKLKKEIESKNVECHTFSLDARKEEEVIKFIETIEQDVGPISVAVYNIGANIKYNILETTSRKYFKVWEMAAFGAFLMGREVAKHMVSRKKGTIIFSDKIGKIFFECKRGNLPTAILSRWLKCLEAV